MTVVVDYLHGKGINRVRKIETIHCVRRIYYESDKNEVPTIVFIGDNDLNLRTFYFHSVFKLGVDHA